MTALSVILTTYQRPRDLERSLAGYRRQDRSDFELLVCDDGSGPETRAVVEAFAARAPFPVRHVWQEDEGFRAARSRNNGARLAQATTLVLSDGDCVPAPDFLSRHAARQAPGRFCAGERFLLRAEESAAVTVAEVESGAAFARVPARERARLRRRRWKDRLYRLSALKPTRPRLLTSNCSLPRAALERVNGLDERFQGWCWEDEDLRRRLVRAGYRASSVVGEANCLHLWHAMDPSWRGDRRLQPNWAYFARGFFLSRCRRGLVERPLRDLAVAVRAADPAQADLAREALGLGPAPVGPPEVELLWDPGPPAPPPRARGDAEVTVLLCAGPFRPERLRGSVDLLLAPEAPLGGGELPGEAHPPLPGALRARVRAARPLPAGAGPAWWEAAAAWLDRVL